MTVASCVPALGALCSQLTFQLVWCRKDSAVTVTAAFAAAGPRWNSLLVQLRNPDIT